MPSSPSELLEGTALLTIADDHELRLGVGVASLGKGPDEHVDSLDGLESTHEEESGFAVHGPRLWEVDAVVDLFDQAGGASSVRTDAINRLGATTRAHRRSAMR